MRRLARGIAVVVAGFATQGISYAAEPSQSSTVVGPANPQLAAGVLALQSGKTEEGIKLTLEGLQLPTSQSDRAAGYSNLCAGYAMLKRWDDALQYCNIALELDRFNWRTFNNRAAIYSAKGEYDLAVNDVRSGLEISPSSRTLQESLRIIQQNKRLVASRTRSSLRPP